MRYSFETLRNHIQDGHANQHDDDRMSLKCLFKVNLNIVLPEVVVVPSIEEVQSSLTRSLQVIVNMLENIPRWSLVSDLETAGFDVSFDVVGVIHSPSCSCGALIFLSLTLIVL